MKVVLLVVSILFTNSAHAGFLCKGPTAYGSGKMVVAFKSADECLTALKFGTASFICKGSTAYGAGEMVVDFGSASECLNALKFSN